MSQSLIVESLKKLSNIEQERAALEVEAVELVKLKQAKQAELDSSKARVKQIDGEVSQMEELRGTLNTESRQLGNQMDQARQKMTRSRNAREINAAQREQEEIRRLLKEREAEAGKLSHAIGLAREEQSRLGELAEQLAAAVAEFDSNTDEAQAQKIAELKASALAVAKEIPGPLLTKYRRIHTRIADPLSPLTDSLCRKCNVVLRPMLVRQILQEGLIDQCPNCQRIVFSDIS